MHPVVTPWKKKTLKTVNIYVDLCWLYTDMDRRVPAMECFKAWRCRFVDCITVKNMDPRHHTLWKVSIYVFKNTCFRIFGLFFFISFVIVYFFRQISINVYEYLWNYLLFWTYFFFFFFFFKSTTIPKTWSHGFTHSLNNFKGLWNMECLHPEIFWLW